MKHVYILVLICCLIGSKSFGQCALINGPGVDPTQMTANRHISSGTPTTDALISGYYAKLSKLYNVTCTVYYIDERNSYAVNSPSDHNVYLGVPLINAILQRSNGNLMVAYLLAHEMAHLLQYNDPKNKFYKDNNYRNSFELQADYLAGYTLCKAGIIGSEFFKDLFSTVQSLGDYGFYDISHHGTPLQRSNALAMGTGVCSLTYLNNVYENSFYYINQGSLLKPFNDKQIMGEFYLYETGRKLFAGRDRIYLNESNELFFKDGDKYLKIGAGFMKQDSYSSFNFEISYNDDIIKLSKDDYGKLLDAQGNKLGEFIFYAGLFQQGAPATLNCHASQPSVLNESSAYAPAITIYNNIIYLAYVNQNGNLTLSTSSDGRVFTPIYIRPGIVSCAPAIAVSGGSYYLAWFDENSHPVVSTSADGHTWSELTVNNLSGAEHLSATMFHGQLYLVWKDFSAHIGILVATAGTRYNSHVLDFQTGKAPCVYVSNDDLVVGGVDMQSGQAYEIQSYNGTEFFNKQFVANINPNNSFDVGIHPVPQLMLIEQWFCWRSNANNNVTINNSFSGNNTIQLNESCIERPVFTFPYFAWTDFAAAHHIKIAKLIPN